MIFTMDIAVAGILLVFSLILKSKILIVLSAMAIGWIVYVGAKK